MEAMHKLSSDIGAGMNRLRPEADDLKKLQTEISGLRMTARNDFRDIAESAASALDMRASKARLDEYEHRLDQVMTKAHQDADLAAAKRHR